MTNVLRPMVIEELRRQYDVEYIREYGVHEFTLRNGGEVTGVSAPTWEEFEGTLTEAGETGQYVISPELITSAASPLEVVAEQQAVIERRIEVAKQISQLHPAATFLLGTATFDTAPRPRNTTLYIRNGIERGRRYKSPYVGDAEKAVFSQGADFAEGERLDPTTLSGICSDLLFYGGSKEYRSSILGLDEWEDPITDKTTSMLIGACWAVPMVHLKHWVIAPESRFKTPLENGVGLLMRQHAQLQEVVMIDRAVPTSGTKGPFNAHFTRKQ